MQLTDGAIRTTGTNVSGYSLFRVSSLLRIDAGAPVGGGRILCSVEGRRAAPKSPRARAACGPPTRAPSTGLYNQEVPETVLLDFSSHGSELAVLELDGVPDRFTTEKGVKLEWPEVPGRHRAPRILPPGRASRSRTWCCPSRRSGRRPRSPRAKVACTLTTSAGKATVRTAAALKKRPAADRRRSRKKKTWKRPKKRKKRRKAEAQPAAARPAAPGLPRIPLPTLFSFGLAGALSIRRGVAAARTSPPRPRR